MVKNKKADLTKIQYKKIYDRVRIFKMHDCNGKSFADDCLNKSSGVSVNDAIDLCSIFGKKSASVFAMLSFNGVKNVKASFLLSEMRTDFRMIDVKNQCFLDNDKQSDLIEFEQVLKILEFQKGPVREVRLVTLMMKETGLSDEACANFLADTVNENVFNCKVINDDWVYSISHEGHMKLRDQRTRITGSTARKIIAGMNL